MSAHPKQTQPPTSRRKRAWLGLLARTQFFVTSTTVVLAIYMHTAHTAWFCVGTLVAAYSAKLLKRMIRQPRPVGAKKFGKKYGMPSTHSSSMAYFGVYLSLCALFLPLHPRVTQLIPGLDYLALRAQMGEDVWQAALYDYTQLATRLALAAFFLGGAGAVCWSRVRLGHHTRAQVIAGASLGAVVATFWLATYLGLESFGEATGTSEWTSKLLAKLAEIGVPAWVTGGFTAQGQKVEDAVMGSVWQVKEAWDAGRWEGVKGVDVRSLPVWTTNWRDEL